MGSPPDRSSFGRIHVGCVPDADIPLAVQAIRLERPFAYAFLAMLDSGPISGVADLIPLLDQHELGHWAISDGLVVEFETLVDLAGEHEYFNGFDEVWLFDEPPVAFHAMPPRFSADRWRVDAPEVTAGPRVDELRRWMLTSHCVAGLGDGFDLNFASLDSAASTVWQALR